MSVRKRKWTTRLGEPREAWIVDYIDQQGDRHIETFARKKEADARQAEVKVDVKAGVHVAPNKSVTVREAGESWIKAAEANGLERSTIKNYREILRLHLAPLIGGVKLSEMSPAVVRNLEDRLRAKGRSPSMIRRTVASLGALIADAQEQGLTAKNAVRDLRRNRRNNSAQTERHEGRLEVGRDIPAPGEIKALLASATGRWRPLLITAVFTGLRASELRGLKWSNVDLKANELHVRERADRFNVIGKPKSRAGHRTVPLPQFVANTLREWKLQCPKGELGLVFPTRKGGIENLANMLRDGFRPIQVKAGIVDQHGQPKYAMHALRHFYASWCINRVEDGGLGLPPKNVQERLGHAKIAMTLDTYGHLFKGGDDRKALDVGVNALLA